MQLRRRFPASSRGFWELGLNFPRAPPRRLADARYCPTNARCRIAADVRALTACAPRECHAAPL